jgi:mRNA-degrading endonuclease toxin of MazEF toxin-antitoxin module
MRHPDDERKSAEARYGHRHPGSGPASSRYRQPPLGRAAALKIIRVPVTSAFRAQAAQVEVGVEAGAEENLDEPSGADCDIILSLPKGVLSRRRGALGPAKLAELDRPLPVALGLA